MLVRAKDDTHIPAGCLRPLGPQHFNDLALCCMQSRRAVQAQHRLLFAASVVPLAACVRWWVIYARTPL